MIAQGVARAAPLPLGDAAHRTPGPTAAVPTAQGSIARVERVLIADDHPMVRDGLRTVIAFAFETCELFEAASFEEAMAVVAREGDFDLVMLDLDMPGANGLSGLRMMREKYPSVPVVIVSAAQERGLARAALTAGASGFIPKSLRRGAIVEALRSILAGEIFIVDDEAAVSTIAREDADVLQRIASLTPQQRVVLGLLVTGKLNKQIAYELGVSMTTVKAHVSAILSKLRVFSRTQAVILVNKVHFGAD